MTPVGKRTLPKKGNNQAPPVSEVLFHFLRLEADWKVEPPPLHPMEREVRKKSENWKKVYGSSTEGGRKEKQTTISQMV